MATRIPTSIKNNNTHIESRVCVGGYEIPCLHCSKEYVGETSHGINKQIYEHRRDLNRANINNSLIKHNLETWLGL